MLTVGDFVATSVCLSLRAEKVGLRRDLSLQQRSAVWRETKAMLLEGGGKTKFEREWSADVAHSIGSACRLVWPKEPLADGESFARVTVHFGNDTVLVLGHAAESELRAAGERVLDRIHAMLPPDEVDPSADVPDPPLRPAWRVRNVQYKWAPRQSEQWELASMARLCDENEHDEKRELDFDFEPDHSPEIMVRRAHQRDSPCLARVSKVRLDVVPC